MDLQQYLLVVAYKLLNFHTLTPLLCKADRHVLKRRAGK